MIMYIYRVKLRRVWKWGYFLGVLVHTVGTILTVLYPLAVSDVFPHPLSPWITRGRPVSPFTYALNLAMISSRP